MPNSKEKKSSSESYKNDIAERLWIISEKLCGMV